jgi:hypothetical protein
MPAHDEGYRRRGVRKGRERGCWVYVPAELLERGGLVAAPDGGAPFYRIWNGRKRTVLVQFYDRQ